jgi:hypothetical protein
MLFVLVGYRFWKYADELKSEYTTAEIIRDVTTFVETHKGQWPRSWEELGHGDVSEFVKMDFAVSIDELLADPNRIHSAIIPVTGRYHTFPHATRNLNYLREQIEKYHPADAHSKSVAEEPEPSK